MPWKEMDMAALAKKSGMDNAEVRAKARVIAEIIKARKAKGLTQARIAQMEGGVGGAHVTLDTLLRMLKLLGVEYRITFKRRAA